MLIAAMYPCPFDAGSSHDYSFSLVKVQGGNPAAVAPLRLASADVYAYEEAKCSGEKHAGSSHFPYRSLSMGFAQLTQRPENVDVWVFPTPSPHYDRQHLFSTLFQLKAIDALPTASEQQELIDSGFVRFVPHQDAHAGLGVYTSPFQEGFYFTLDGGGDLGDPRDTVFGSFGKGSRGLQHAWEVSASRQSLSWFHERLTEYFGFNQLDNGKVSGLAAYGKVDGAILEYFDSLIVERDSRRPLVEVSREGRTPTDFSRADLDNFTFHRLVNPAPGLLSIVPDLASFSPLDVAASGEQFFRNLVTSSVLALLEEHDVPRFGAFTGGVFNNVRLNQDLAECSAFRSHFTMAPGDAGLALGAALVAVADHREARVSTAFLGPGYSSSAIEKVLEQFHLPKRRADVAAVAQLIAGGSIVGWFSGRAEYGPRSLGARSILGDPRDTDIKARLNQLAKRRDFFMPFAPAVLAEHLSALGADETANAYMQVAVTLSSAGMNLVPAAVHVDGTSRVQVVNQDTNPEFHALISAFHELTGVPAVLNTSFNRHGISTIATPRAAIEHLLQGCVEHLYLDGFLVSRSDFSPDIPMHEETRSEARLMQEMVTGIREKHEAVIRQVPSDALGNHLRSFPRRADS